MRQLKSGAGWRLGWDATADFAGLVGTESWAVELTAAELEDFSHLLLDLAATMAQMQTELMSEERISCEAETGLLWMEVEGCPDRYRLRLILLSGRRAEAEWDESATAELLQAVQTLKLF